MNEQVKQVEGLFNRSPVLFSIVIVLLASWFMYGEYNEMQGAKAKLEQKLILMTQNSETETRERSDSYMTFMQAMISKIEENQRIDSRKRADEMAAVYQILVKHTEDIKEVRALLIDMGLLPIDKGEDGIARIQTPRFRRDNDMLEPNIDKHRYWLGTLKNEVTND